MDDREEVGPQSVEESCTVKLAMLLLDLFISIEQFITSTYDPQRVIGYVLRVHAALRRVQWLLKKR